MLHGAEGQETGHKLRLLKATAQTERWVSSLSGEGLGRTQGPRPGRRGGSGGGCTEEPRASVCGFVRGASRVGPGWPSLPNPPAPRQKRGSRTKGRLPGPPGPPGPAGVFRTKAEKAWGKFQKAAASSQTRDPNRELCDHRLEALPRATHEQQPHPGAHTLTSQRQVTRARKPYPRCSHGQSGRRPCPPAAEWAEKTCSLYPRTPSGRKHEWQERSRAM